MDKRGFFIKDLTGRYHGPRETLAEARSLAREKCPGKKIPIYHGILIEEEDKQDDKELYLVPKKGGQYESYFRAGGHSSSMFALRERQTNPKRSGS